MKFILGLVSLVLVLIVIMMSSTQLPGLTGTIDHTHSSLIVSGVPISELIILKWVGLIMGLCVVSIFLSAVAIGAHRKDSIQELSIRNRIIIGSILYIGVYCWMVISWWDYSTNNAFEYFLGLPIPTAIMMFGLLFSPAFLSYFYITKFDSWVYSSEDERAFQLILERKKNRTK